MKYKTRSASEMKYETEFQYEAKMKFENEFQSET